MTQTHVLAPHVRPGVKVREGPLLMRSSWVCTSGLLFGDLPWYSGVEPSEKAGLPATTTIVSLLLLTDLEFPVQYARTGRCRGESALDTRSQPWLQEMQTRPPLGFAARISRADERDAQHIAPVDFCDSYALLIFFTHRAKSSACQD